MLPQVMDEMRIASVEVLTVGQHLQPAAKYHPNDRILFPEEFRTIEGIALSKGSLEVSATPMGPIPFSRRRVCRVAIRKAFPNRQQGVA